MDLTHSCAIGLAPKDHKPRLRRFGGIWQCKNHNTVGMGRTARDAFDDFCRRVIAREAEQMQRRWQERVERFERPDMAPRPFYVGDQVPNPFRSPARRTDVLWSVR